MISPGGCVGFIREAPPEGQLNQDEQTSRCRNVGASGLVVPTGLRATYDRRRKMVGLRPFRLHRRTAPLHLVVSEAMISQPLGDRGIECV